VIAKKDAAAAGNHHPSVLPPPEADARKSGDKAAEADVFKVDQRAMMIPFSIKDGNRAEVKRIFLYASTDLGKTWKQSGEASPSGQAIRFVAPRDGLYWFSTQLLFKDDSREPSDLEDLITVMKVRIKTSADGDKSSN
jgi:hypothetical protein